MRQTTTDTEPMVYLDDRLLGGLTMLRDIPAISIFEIRHFSASQAQTRWGRSHSNGAILVVSVRN